ncbi:MAG: NAD-dependent epimerase/dehydratase family protein [Myxococcota bacterium]
MTGIAGNLGRATARRLHRTFDVVGVDRRPVRHMPKDIAIERVDIRRRRAEDIFRRERIDAVVHMNILHDPRADQRKHHEFNLMGTQKIANLCAQHDVPKLIVLSSADVYGAAPTNDQFLLEDAPLMGGQRFGGMRDLISMDMASTSFFWRHPELETVLLRPVHIIGKVNNAPSRYLRMKRPVMLLGFDPMIQLVHVEDLVTAIERALTPGIRGIFNIAGPSPVPLSYAIKRAGRRPLVLPEPVARGIMQAAWSLQLSDWPAPELDYIKYVCMVDDSLARTELGYHHAHDLDSILQDT